MWTRLLVARFFLLEPAVFLMFWSVMGQIWQHDSLACVVYRSHCSKLRSIELPMKENVSGYSHNPCSLSREWDAVSAVKLLLLSTCFFDRRIWGVRWRERGSMSNTLTYGWYLAPSASELAWFYMGFRQSVTPECSHCGKLRSVSFPTQRTRVT